MKRRLEYPLGRTLGLALVTLALSAPSVAQSIPTLNSPDSRTRVGASSCSIPLPLPPGDPSEDSEYGCYYFGNYTWNIGNGAGNVQGRIYWPSICGDGTTNPPGKVPLPTVLLMHGDNQSYLDYHYLMRHLAVNGFIVATIQNGGTNAERSLQAQSYLSFMANNWSRRAWVDRDNMGLIGHSRGGEAVLTVARHINEMGLDYDVNAIISLAPTDSQEGGGPPESLVRSSSESLLVIYGTHDDDVTGRCVSGNLLECNTPPVGTLRSGFALYDRAGSEGGTEPFPLYDEVVDKTLLYVKGANHNSWRSTCGGFPGPGVLSCAEHQSLARGYMNAFLRWQLRGQGNYRHYFSGDFRLPIVEQEDIVVHTSYSKGYDRRVVDNFEQPGWGTNTIGGQVSKESSLTVEADGPTWSTTPTSPHDTRSLTVSWGPGGLAPWLRFAIPDNASQAGGRYRDIKRFDYLSLRAGQVYDSAYNTPDASKDFWVQLRDSNGGLSTWERVSDHADLPYPTVARVPKQGQLIDVTTSAMKTIRIPVCRFEGIDLENVSSVWFFFTAQGSSSGELLLDNIEFTD